MLPFLQEALELRLCVVQTKSLPSGFRSTRHAHSFYELGVVLEGTCTWKLRGRTLRRLRAGDMILIPPKCDHHEEAGGGVRLGWVGFIPGNSRERLIRQARDEDGSVQFLLNHLNREQNQPGSSAICAVTLQHILLLFQKAEKRSHVGTTPPAHSLNARQVQIVQSVASYLDRNAIQRLSMEQVANYHQLSAHHLNVLFQSYYQTTPTNYRLRRRIESAGSMLAEGRPIKEVARECGFTDTAHFTREFKLRTGRTPGEARNEPRV